MINEPDKVVATIEYRIEARRNMSCSPVGWSDLAYPPRALLVLDICQQTRLGAVVPRVKKRPRETEAFKLFQPSGDLFSPSDASQIRRLRWRVRPQALNARFGYRHGSKLEQISVHIILSDCLLRLG